MKIKIEDEIEYELEEGEEEDDSPEDWLENDEITPEEAAFMKGEKEASFKKDKE